MRKRYKVVSIPASLTPYASVPGQVLELEEEAARQWAGYLVELPPDPVQRAMDVPPVHKMIVKPAKKKERSRG